MSLAPNYYEILQADHALSDKELRKVYLGEVRKWHPDNFGGKPSPQAAEEMRKLNEAWETLGDPTKRKIYDADLKKSLLRTPQEGTLLVTDRQFIDPDRLTKQRWEQEKKTSLPKIKFLRFFPVLLVVLLAVGLLLAVFGPESSSETSPAAETSTLNVGKNIVIGDCVKILTGPAFIEVACSANSDGYLDDVKEAGQSCRSGLREIVLQNDVVACLG